MELKDAIAARRAYRSLEAVEIGEAAVRSLIEEVRLAPSCNNNQPWRFIFAYSPAALEALKKALNKGNSWAQAASMIVAVASRKDLDCDIHEKDYQEREYYLFDTGMAAAYLILRITERGLVAHPIAGFNEKMAKEAIGMGDDMKLITLVIVGARSGTVSPVLSDGQKKSEASRPARKGFEEIAFLNGFAPPGALPGIP